MSAEVQQHTYSRGAAVLAQAAEAWGVSRVGERMQEWGYLIAAAYALDNVLDTNEKPRQEREQCFDALLEKVVSGKFITKNTNGEEVVGSWATGRQEQVWLAAQEVKSIAYKKRIAQSANILGQLAVREGEETARFLSVSEEERTSPMFNSWLSDLFVVGVVVDSAVDLPEDYTNNLIIVSPTRRNQLIVGSYSFASALRLARTTPHPWRMYKILRGAASATVKDSKKDSNKRNKITIQ